MQGLPANSAIAEIVDLFPDYQHLALVEVGNRHQEHPERKGTNKRKQVLRAKRRLRTYGLPESHISAGLCLIKGGNYALGSLNFILRFTDYDPERLETTLAALEENRHLRTPIAQLRERTTTLDLTLSETICPHSRTARNRLIERWLECFKEAYDDFMGVIKGPLLERYALNAFKESNEELGGNALFYRNVILHPLQGQQKLEADIIILADEQTVRALFFKLPQLYAAKLKTHWRRPTRDAETSPLEERKGYIASQVNKG